MKSLTLLQARQAKLHDYLSPAVVSVASRPDCYGMMTRYLQRFVVIGCERHCYLFSVSRLAAPQDLFPNQPLGRFGRLFQFLQERVS
jgi:hypothetical protein